MGFYGKAWRYHKSHGGVEQVLLAMAPAIGVWALAGIVILVVAFSFGGGGSVCGRLAWMWIAVGAVVADLAFREHTDFEMYGYEEDVFKK